MFAFDELTCNNGTCLVERIVVSTAKWLEEFREQNSEVLRGILGRTDLLFETLEGVMNSYSFHEI